MTVRHPASRGDLPPKLDINVLNFGAKGDGVADDTDAFNRALRALGEGQHLYVPRGTYKITSQLTEPTVVYWGMTGESEHGTTFNVAGIGTGVPLITLTKRGAALEAFEIFGDVAAAPSYTVHGIHVGGGTATSNHTLRHLRISYCAVGIELNNAHDSKDYSAIELFQNTIDIKTVTTVCSSQRFYNCSMLESEQCLDIGKDATNFVFNGCTFAARPYNTATKPVNIDHAVHAMLFRGCRFEHKDTNSVGDDWDCIYVSGFDSNARANSVDIVGNYFTGNVLSGVHFESNIRALSVIGNHFLIEPATADIESSTSTRVDDCVSGWNSFEMTRTTKSIVFSLNTATDIKKLENTADAASNETVTGDWTFSGVLTSSNAASGVVISNNTPQLQWRETDAATNEKNWDAVAIGGQLRFRAVNDAISGWTEYITIDRVTTDVTDVNVLNASLNIGGSVYLDEKAAATADVAGRGQLWVKNTTPCQLWFTDDAGTDTQIV